MYSKVFKSEDGALTLKGYGKRLTVKEVVECIDNAENWSDIGSEIYNTLCIDLNINYAKYDDPDDLFDAIVEATDNIE